MPSTTDKTRARIVPVNNFTKKSNQPIIQYEKPIKGINDFVVITTSTPEDLLVDNPYGYDMITDTVEFKNETYSSFDRLFDVYGSIPTVSHPVDKNGGDPLAGQINPDMAVSFSFHSDDGFFAFQFRRPLTALCSDYRVTFSIDGTTVLTSDWLVTTDPRVTPVYRVWVGGVGSHIIKLQPEGRLGGCNHGAIVAWGGTFENTSS